MSISPEDVAGLCGYMNANQAAYNLLLVQWLAGERSATEATMVGFDNMGADYMAVVDGQEKAVRLPWTHELNSRDEVRADLFVLVDRAMAVYEPED